MEHQVAPSAQQVRMLMYRQQREKTHNLRTVNTNVIRDISVLQPTPPMDVHYVQDTQHVRAETGPRMYATKDITIQNTPAMLARRALMLKIIKTWPFATTQVLSARPGIMPYITRQCQL